MGNHLEFILSLTDMLSPTILAAAKIAESTGGRMQKSIEAVKNASQSLGANNFGNKMAEQFNEPIAKVKELNSQLEHTKNIGSSNSNGGFGNLLGSLGVGFGAGMIGKQALEQSANAESQKIAFKVMTGSKGEGDKLYSDIVKMADVTPYESQDLARSGKTMLGYGVDKSKIMPDLNMIGDIAAATDHPAESLQSLALAFGQVTAKGHLAGQEVMQMINAGFNPLKEISLATGISMNSLEKAQEKGAITSKMVELAFKHATGEGGKYHNMMKEQSETLGGKWSTFMDGVHHKLMDFGNFLSPTAKKLMDFVTEHKEAFTIIAGAIGVVALATTGWSAAMGILNVITAANPIMLLATGILFVGSLIGGYLVTHFSGWGTSMKAIWQIIKSFVALNVIAWVQLYEAIAYNVNAGWLKFKIFIESVQGAIHNLKEAFSLILKGDFTGAKDALFKEIISPSSKALDELEKKHKEKNAGYISSAALAAHSIAENYGKISLKKRVGETAAAVNPVTENTPVDGSGFGGLKNYKNDGTGKDKADRINSGGQRSIMITIGKQIEKLEVHVVGGGKEVANEMEAAIREGLRRVLYSVNGAVTN